MTSISIEDDMDLSMRAPYISMSEADDLPLLISEDLMWGALPCDSNKFVHESKLNTQVDMTTMQVLSDCNVDMEKAGDYLLSNIKGHNNNESLTPAKNVSLVGNSSSKRRREQLSDKEEANAQDNTEATPLIHLLLEQVGSAQKTITSESCGSISEDTNQSGVIDPMFDDSLTKNCEFR